MVNIMFLGVHRFKPAGIFASSTGAREGETVSLKCTVPDINSNDSLHVYLCKNGVGQRMERLSRDNEAIFSLTNVTVQDSGKYSCVYTSYKIKYNEVNSTGIDFIFIQISDRSPTGTYARFFFYFIFFY